MSRKSKRRANKRQITLLKGILTLEALEFGDYMKMAVALIHDRDSCYEKAEGYRKQNDLTRALTWEDKGHRYNKVLVKINHPAAIHPCDSNE